MNTNYSSADSQEKSPAKICIGLFGFGTVGQGVYKVLSHTKNAHAEIRRICVSNIDKEREVATPPGLITDDPQAIFGDPDINLIVELVNDPQASYSIVTTALCRGIPVVSGSKTMIARHLPTLIDLQRRHNTALLYDASSCGSIPVIRNLEEYYDNDLLLEVKGILNGSSNYILSQVFDHGKSYQSALCRAQELGFAEKDPSFDVDGYDALFKLIIITVHALGRFVPAEQVFTYGISHIHDTDINYAREKGAKIKLVAQVAKVDDSRFTMFVMPEIVEKSKYIYSVDDEYNGVVIRGEGYDRQFMFGKGAGGLPTASSILSDIMARLHNYRYEYKKMGYVDRPDYTTDIDLRVYIRYRDTDVRHILPISRLHELHLTEESNYLIADIPLNALIEHRDLFDAPDVFIANIPRFFIDRDRSY